ncbi:CKLF-like MARVEL transmembrane domain-containing protein 4 [Folsomia candida]|uniref:CKLF-like MARVEL transmembrane domain-containing protein 4 n=1 Tax=Folsomia candida TaxID=158441 RepID=A0A226F3G8_FOLCA|nr:CKLF-like MARVEL transmembrane domain-containing protein 4 [Folsomia candida]
MDPEAARFPATHTTTTTTATTSVVTDVRFDPSYVRTLPGTLKCAQMAIAQRSNAHNANWFAFVAFGGLLITLILFLLFLFHLVEKLHFLPWLLIELVYCGIWTFFYFTAATAVASMGHIENPFAAAAFFGYLARNGVLRI